MSTASVVVGPVLPAPVTTGSSARQLPAPRRATRIATSAGTDASPVPVARTTATTVGPAGDRWPALDVLLTGVPSDLEPLGGFPSGPVDGYPRPTTYRLVPDSPEGPFLLLPIGLWGDQPAAIFADVAARGFDVLVKSGSRRVGDEQRVALRRFGSGAH